VVALENRTPNPAVEWIQRLFSSLRSVEWRCVALLVGKSRFPPWPKSRRDPALKMHLGEKLFHRQLTSSRFISPSFMIYSNQNLQVEAKKSICLEACLLICVSLSFAYHKSLLPKPSPPPEDNSLASKDCTARRIHRIKVLLLSSLLF
jgi:hypothetical protein